VAVFYLLSTIQLFLTAYSFTLGTKCGASIGRLYRDSSQVGKLGARRHFTHRVASDRVRPTCGVSDRGGEADGGTRRLQRLEENIGAVAVELTPDDLHDIERVASQITVQGARYPEDRERLTGR